MGIEPILGSDYPLLVVTIKNQIKLQVRLNRSKKLNLPDFRFTKVHIIGKWIH